ncbi:hypothetical protein ACWGVR_23335 [Streptomyces xanthophaeus]
MDAWDSGASAWTPTRREAYANDQGRASSLVAVSARSNRRKADQDPAQWLPSLGGESPVRRRWKFAPFSGVGGCGPWGLMV